MLDANSAIVKAFRMERDWCHADTTTNVELRLLSERARSKQYNSSTVAEVAALITNDFSDGEPTRDIVFCKKESPPKRILELHPSYMALKYPLLFPYREDGYHEKIPYHTNKGKRKTTKDYVTMKEYYAYYLVDAFTTIEEQRLSWTRNNQDTLRVDLYHNVVDAITRGNANTAGLGKIIALPISFTGGPRFKAATDIDDIIPAELPSPTVDPTGYKAASDYMLHGPFGKDNRAAACNIEGKCSKHFPKPYYAETVINQGGCPIYRRTDDKVCVKKGNFTFDNKHVVPYNRYLLLKYHAHINVEWCNRLKAIKYLFKYLNKGPDRATIVIQENVQQGQGITSLLLPGGRTAHSRFVIPLELLENSTCGIKPNTHLAELMQQVELIIWDEAPMTQKYAFEALDKTLRDILGYQDPDKHNKIFGGMTVLLGGDFKQILPVIPKGNRADIVQACINRSELWKHCKVLTLKQSMRVNEYNLNGDIDTRKQAFNQWVLAVGDGKVPAKIKDGENEPTWIDIPETFLIPSSESPIQLIFKETYPNFIQRQKDDAYLRERAILTHRNDDADAINAYMFDKLAGQAITYHSVDEICKGSTDTLDQYNLYPTEFLNTLNF
ncbi:ATP-dependent DNA helicase PIF1-like protein [Tanacetum coccineum]